MTDADARKAFWKKIPVAWVYGNIKKNYAYIDKIIYEHTSDGGIQMRCILRDRDGTLCAGEGVLAQSLVIGDDDEASFVLLRKPFEEEL